MGTVVPGGDSPTWCLVPDAQGFYRRLMPCVRRLRCVVVVAAVLIGVMHIASPVHAADTWTQQGAAIDGTVTLDNSGWSVTTSSDGTSIAIGAPGNNDNTGSVRVFDWDGSAWSQRGNTLTGRAIEDFFGISVAMSADGMTLAIGSSGSSGDTGLVRIYTYDAPSNQWLQVGPDINSEAAGDLSGFSVAMSADGTTVAIGAPYNSGNGARSGQVRVYTYDAPSNQWLQVGSDIDGEAAGDLAGYSVALAADGTTVAVGAPYNADNGARSGQVRVFTWNGVAWIQRGTDLDGEAAGDLAGHAVAMSSDGTTVAIGAPGNDGVALDAGQVRVFSWSGTTWTGQGTDLDGEGPSDQFGYSVAMSADGLSVVIGAPTSDIGGVDRGRVRVFSWNGTTWLQRGATIEGESAGDLAGWSVAMSADGSFIAEGSPFSDDVALLAGQVRAFTWTGQAPSTPGPPTTFRFLLPDGRECSAVSPMQVRVGTVVELPGVDAICRTMPGSTVAGWTIPVPHGFTGYGSSFEPFPPGLRVRVVESQRFTLVPFDPVIQVDYDANVAASDSCTPTDAAHGSGDGRVANVWVPRVDFAMARTAAHAPCVPDGYRLTGWNTAGDGSGTTIELGAPLPEAWAAGSVNHHTLYAVWSSSS